MDQEAIKKILPHRDNMLLVQEAEVVDGVAHAKYHVSGDEWFLKGHFPGNPVVPGVILCEMMAQGACVLLADGQMGDVTPMFSSMNNVRFKSPVKPGDTLESESVITKSKGPFYFASAKGYVDGKLAGKIGVIGPTRMKYSEVTSVIEYLTDNISNAFKIKETEGEDTDE